MKKVLFIFVILIFLLFGVYNVSSYLIDMNYKKISGIEYELEELKDMVNDSKVINKIESIQEDVKFLNEVCFEE